MRKVKSIEKTIIDENTKNTVKLNAFLKSNENFKKEGKKTKKKTKNEVPLTERRKIDSKRKTEK